MIPVTVLTPSIPERRELLGEAIESVNRQTVQPAAHLVLVQRNPANVHPMVHLIDSRNQLASAAATPWIATLDDDDVYLPSHFEAIAPLLDSDADVIYTRPVEMVLPPLSLVGMEQHNLLCSNACIRTRSLAQVGYWSSEGFDPQTHKYNGSRIAAEDWHLWYRMLRAGMRFAYIDRATWHYRMGPWRRLSEDLQ
jgi:hypothetical protein